MESPGRIAFKSRVAVSPFGKGVPVSRGGGVRVSPSEKGWKGVNVGVAFAGAVIRNRLAGVGAGSKAPVVFPLGAAQPVIKIMRIAVRSVRLMPFLLSVGG